MRRKGFPICPYYAIRAHLRDPGPAKRRGHQDRLQYAGPLRRKVHPSHLHPRHPADAVSGSGNHGKFHEPDDVTPPLNHSKASGRKAKLPARCSLTLSAHFPVWVKLWVTPPDPLFDPHYFEGKQNKNSRNPAISGVSWSCYPDLNWRPHPYQKATACFMGCLVMLFYPLKSLWRNEFHAFPCPCVPSYLMLF